MNKVARGPALLVLGVLLLQAAWIVTTPPFRGIDEFDHAFRAAAVAGGEWVPGMPAEAGRGRLVTVPRDIAEAAHAQCAALEYTGPDNCSPVKELPTGRVQIASSAADYPPLFYWVVGTVALPFEGAAALYAMRIATALLSLFFVGVAAWAMGLLRGAWPMIGLILGLTPVFIYSTTVAAPNGVEMGAGVALWATLLALVDGRSRNIETRLLWGAILSAAVLGGLRLLGPAFLLMILSTVAALDWRATRDLIRRRLRLALLGTGIVGASVAAQAYWMFHVVVDEVSTPGAENPSVVTASSLIAWPLQTIAAFPLRTDSGPGVVYLVVAVLVMGLVVTAWRRGLGRARVLMLVTLIASLAFPYVFTLPTVDSVGNIWQGRYLLPYSVGLVLLAGYALGRRRPGPSLPRTAFLLAGTSYAVALASCYIKLRSDELSGRSASIADAAWHPPSPFMLVAITAVAVALLTAAVVRTQEPAVIQGTRPDPRVSAEEVTKG